jgi:hypothetical protein
MDREQLQNLPGLPPCTRHLNPPAQLRNDAVGRCPMLASLMGSIFIIFKWARTSEPFASAAIRRLYPASPYSS